MYETVTGYVLGLFTYSKILFAVWNLVVLMSAQCAPRGTL